MAPEQKRQEAAKPLNSQEEILDILTRLEVPDCGCKLVFIDCGCKAKAKYYKERAKELRKDYLAARQIAQRYGDDDQAWDDAEAIAEEITVAKNTAAALSHCHCPTLLGPPCRHVLETPDCNYDTWAKLAMRFDPHTFKKRSQDWYIEHDYRNPPDPEPERMGAIKSVLQRQTRVALYATRHDSGQRLFGRHDILDTESLERVARRLIDLGLRGGDRLRNGQDRQLGLATGKEMRE